MDKVNDKKLLRRLLKYLIPCFIVCAVGIIIIERITFYLQRWYAALFIGVVSTDFVEVDHVINITETPDNLWMYQLAGTSRIILIPLWAILCLWFAAMCFYRREIERPLDTLTDASEKILADDLDFKVECDTDNELGQLCGAFENMRADLYASNYRLWKSLEERKRLNSAFSHDLRTPITVMKGYIELMEQFDGELSEEKQKDIMKKMSVHINRLEHYTEKMSSIHKLEDIIPEVNSFTFGKLCSQLDESGRLLCDEKKFEFTAVGEENTIIYSDIELIMQVFMNLAANAVRYTETCVGCSTTLNDDKLEITVTDDGKGFSEDALRKAWQPFYRDEQKDEQEHFGLGLYICWLLCRKLGGNIKVENCENGGGKVTAEFSVKNQKIR